MPCTRNSSHAHTWPTSGDLKIWSCERICGYCGLDSHKQASHLRAHVLLTHAKRMPGLTVLPGEVGNAGHYDVAYGTGNGNSKRGSRRARKQVARQSAAGHQPTVDHQTPTDQQAFTNLQSFTDYQSSDTHQPSTSSPAPPGEAYEFPENFLRHLEQGHDAPSTSTPPATAPMLLQDLALFNDSSFDFSTDPATMPLMFSSTDPATADPIAMALFSSPDPATIPDAWFPSPPTGEEGVATGTGTGTILNIAKPVADFGEREHQIRARFLKLGEDMYCEGVGARAIGRIMSDLAQGWLLDAARFGE